MPTLKQIIYTELRNEIVFGRLVPGEHVKESGLTEKFQCSRGPVREAFNQLEKEGFLKLYPNQGAVVKRTSPQEVLDYYALLELLEAEAVRLATPLLTPADFEALESTNAAIEKIARDDRSSIEAWVPLNHEFHRLFRERCGNSRMNWIVEEVRMRITRYRYTSLLVTASGEYVSDHQKIIEAARRGDADSAANAMRRHIRRAKTVLMEFLAKFPEF